jgi:GGDEF domain-containing protein
MMMEAVRKLVDLNNQFYPGMLLSLSMGAATSAAGERLEDVVRRADFAMYEAKRAFYSNLPNDRRQRGAAGHPAATN